MKKLITKNLVVYCSIFVACFIVIPYMGFGLERASDITGNQLPLKMLFYIIITILLIFLGLLISVLLLYAGLKLKGLVGNQNKERREKYKVLLISSVIGLITIIILWHFIFFVFEGSCIPPAGFDNLCDINILKGNNNVVMIINYSLIFLSLSVISIVIFAILSLIITNFRRNKDIIKRDKIVLITGLISSLFVIFLWQFFIYICL